MTLRDQPELMDRVAAWFHEKWRMPSEAYLECMYSYLNLLSADFFLPMRRLGSYFHVAMNGMAASDTILDEAPETEDVTGKDLTAFTGAELKNVEFSYGGEMVLDDLSLMLPENRIIGIVGRSGCGKSTLLKLLMRFWRVKDGAVMISG